jgi:hypothetical protein
VFTQLNVLQRYSLAAVALLLIVVVSMFGISLLGNSGDSRGSSNELDLVKIFQDAEAQNKNTSKLGAEPIARKMLMDIIISKFPIGSSKEDLFVYLLENDFECIQNNITYREDANIEIYCDKVIENYNPFINLIGKVNYYSYYSSIVDIDVFVQLDAL